MTSHRMTRRQCLQVAAATTFCAQGVAPAREPVGAQRASRAVEPKAVAGVITAYAPRLHADVLLGKILEGWKQDGGAGPALKLSALYVDQFPKDDLARKMAQRFNVPIFDSIEKAVTVGGNRIPVDGVISIGEHGDYPWNAKEQHLYPRRRFFREITDTFRKYDRVVPVFNDKHLGPVWADAKWMYDRAREMRVPFMAGSSMPLSFRKPDATLPMGSRVESAIAVGYAGLDIYGAHTLECFQCLLERRAGGETGVKSVQCIQGKALWQALDGGLVPADVLKAALDANSMRAGQAFRDDAAAALFVIKYVDGLVGAVLMLPGAASGLSVAIKVQGKTQPLAIRFEERTEPRHPHFAYLLKAVERMFHTGRPSYPVERTLLTSGILDRALTSRERQHKKLLTPELAIRYKPADYPHAPKPELTSAPV